MKPLPVRLVGLLSDNRTSVRQPVEQSIPSRARLMVCCPVAGAVRSVPCMVLSYTYPFYVQSSAPGGVFGSFLLQQTQTALSVQAALWSCTLSKSCLSRLRLCDR